MTSTLGRCVGLAVASAVATGLLVPIVRKGLLRANVVDIPNARSSHSQAIPRGGGLAVFGGSAAGLALHHAQSRRAVGPTAAFALGLADDVTGGLPASARLGAQAAIGALSGRNLREAVVGLVAVPASVNVFNFMDGINGISATTATVVLTNAALESGLDADTRALALAGAGAAVGFLPWNAPKAWLFLGDAGSYYVGGLIATCLIGASSAGPSALIRVAAPYSLYVLDVAQAIVLRARRGENLFEAHRRHVYQQALDGSGASHIEIAALHAIAATAIAAAVRAPLSPGAQGGIVATVAGAYLSAGVWVPRVRPRG
ncbi:hypothetical protein [Demetria terragena]|uniref:hypothetical protein n=1 Tax=Demetria terragena TaxID=63959 RepID=UPI000369DDFD|nr:hypothetical protein [Demetria terragena]